MKKFLVCFMVTLLAGASAFSADWSKLRKDNRLAIDAPSYVLVDAKYRRAFEVSVLDLCRDGAVVRTAGPVTICTQEVTDYSQNAPYFPKKCLQHAAVYPAHAVDTTETVCVKSESRPNASGYYVPVCVQTEERPAGFPMSHSIKVTQYWESATYYARNKADSWTEEFTIPSCQ